MLFLMRPVPAQLPSPQNSEISKKNAQKESKSLSEKKWPRIESPAAKMEETRGTPHGSCASSLQYYPSSVDINLGTVLDGTRLALGPLALFIDRLHLVNGPAKVQLGVFLWHMLAAVDAKHPHTWPVGQSAQQLGRDQEILATTAAADGVSILVSGPLVIITRDIHQAAVDHALVSRVHTLVDLVDDTEG